MAALTSDLVWLVKQTLTLADGQTTRALVPQRYGGDDEEWTGHDTDER